MPVTEQLNQLAVASRILEMEGHGDMTLGHVSLRDPHQRGFWLKQNARGLGEITSAADFILVDFDGKKLEGEGGQHSEWPIHSEIFLARPDVNVVAHTHPLHASILSSLNTELQPFTLDADYFVSLPVFEDQTALLVKKEQGAALAAALGKNFAVLLANHGVTFCGTSIEHATCVGIFLERAARIQLMGMQTGKQAVAPDSSTRAQRHSQVMTDRHVKHSWDYFVRKLQALEKTTGQKQLFN